MNWLMTNAQIELMASDVSVVDYGTSKNKKKRSKGEFDNTKASASSVKKASKEWLEKYGNSDDAGKGLNISDIFGNGVRADIKVKE